MGISTMNIRQQLELRLRVGAAKNMYNAPNHAVRKRQQAFDAIVHPVIASCYEAHKQEDDDDGEDPSDDKFFDGDK